MIKTHYDAIADVYTRTRWVSEHVIAELQSFCCITPASRVLEVGCGTANHIHALVDRVGCAGWGVDPSEGMLHHAPVHCRLNVCLGSADCIPFEDGFFDLLFSVNVIHHLPSPERYFEESLRVLRPGGRICTFTDSTEVIRRREPLSRYWPMSAEADIARYPTVAALLKAMNQAGYVNLTAREIKKTSLISDATPFRERAFSCLQLIDDLQFEKGLRLLEEDLSKGPVRMTSEYVCIWGDA